jgi:uncharacterized protein YuzE
MNVKYFKDTDTAYLKFNSQPVKETKEINNNLFLDLDKDGNIVGLTIEHAKLQADFSKIIYEEIPEKTNVLK